VTRRADYAEARLAGLCTLCGSKAGKRWACLACRQERNRVRQAVRAVSLAELKTDRHRVTRLAKRRGGVSVVDVEGVPVFHLWIPSEALP
jgi:hypothetical protein